MIKADLLALADRCEREEPSRELDFAIGCAVLGWKAWRSKHGYWNFDGPEGKSIATSFDSVPYKFDPETGEKNPHYDSVPSITLADKADFPEWTTSLDAAVTPEGDDVFWRSGHDGEGPAPSLFKAEVLVRRLGVPFNNFVARAQTEPMARRAAELRARAAVLP